jgi:hypothetical protein
MKVSLNQSVSSVSGMINRNINPKKQFNLSHKGQKHISINKDRGINTKNNLLQSTRNSAIMKLNTYICKAF